VASIKAKFPDQPVAAIVSFSVLNADSRLHDGLQELSHLVDYVITTEFGINQDVHQQSVDTEAVVQACRDIACTV